MRTEFTQKIEDIERRFQGLEIAPAPGRKNQPIALVGLKGASSADAVKEWETNAIEKADIDGIVDVYDKCKEEEFQRHGFRKFLYRGEVECGYRKVQHQERIQRDARVHESRSRNPAARQIQFPPQLQEVAEQVEAGER